ncbi:MAG: glycoside hydrolase family 38 C-terminal domain-containing protein [Gemmatimonadota bacterium]
MVGAMKRTAFMVFLVGLVLAACVPADPDAESEEMGGDPSLLRVPLPSPFLSGYAGDLRGEVLSYHSPIPSVGTSLLVRSEDRARSIAWGSQVVPPDFGGGEATFAIMLGIDVHQEPRQFDLQVNGREALQFQNPTQAALGDTLIWVGEGGIRGEFHVTLIDRYGDAMGFLFLTIPRDRLDPGNPVRFEVLGETAGARTWFMVFRDPVQPHVTLRNAPAVLRTPDGEVQAIRLDLLSLETGKVFHLDSPVGQVDTTVPLGHTRITLPVPAVTSPGPVVLNIGFGEHQETVSYTVRPPRRMEVYLLHHTHLDIGYTHHQDEVERIQWASLEEALRLGEDSEDFPKGARFIWNPEGIWPVDSYVRTHPGEKSDRLLDGIRRGWIELDGMYAGLLTGLANEEALLHAFDAGRELAERSGVPIESEMVSDIPGFSWGLVEAMARNGIRYLSIGPNFGHRIGYLTEALGDRPFYWQGPSGEDRVLTWVSGGGYAWFHSGLGYDSISARLDEEKVFRYVDQLVSTEYPYDITYLRYNIGSDNGPPDPGLAEAVRDWNERYASPILRISGTTEAFREFEGRYGEGLPTYRGDMTGYWEDGAASSARETAMVRRVAEALPQTETLAEMRGVALDPELLAEGWRNVLLFYEHTWGSWNSISEPYAELTTTSWDRKRDFAEAAVEVAGRLRDHALSEGRGVGRETESNVFEVHNTFDWARTDLIVLSSELSRIGDRVFEVGGETVPSQRLTTGELAFLAKEVPARGMKTYRVEEGGALGSETLRDDEKSPTRTLEGLDAPGDVVLASASYSIHVDPETGTIRSLVHRASGRDIVARGDSGLNQYLYVPGRDPEEVVTSGAATIRQKEVGPLVWSMEITAPAPGLQKPFSAEVRLVEGLDRVDILNSVSKEWILDPEAVLFRFPFAFENPTVWIDGPFGAFRPEVDQLPGASKNYYSVQRWVDLSDPDIGVTFAAVDAPLIQLGEIRTDAIISGWVEKAEPSGTLFSYVMNNYWETNYRAAQDDDVQFHYSIMVHGPFREEEAQRFGLERARPLIHRFVER